MLYTIIASDRDETVELRAAARPRHLDYLAKLVNDGRVVLAGPHPRLDSPDPGPAGFSGSLIVAEFESLEAAEAWVANDPYTLDGIFESVVIKPFVQVAP